jgi:threonine aldolase
MAANDDSVQFCLSKGLAAPVGSIVAGAAEFVTQVRRNRKLVGGAMRQAGVIAAAGLVALNEMIDRLPDDHARARRLAGGLSEIPGVKIDLYTVQSNIVIFRPPAGLGPQTVVEGMAAEGVRLSNYGTRGLRMVTHYEIDDAAVERALVAAARVMAPVAV